LNKENYHADILPNSISRTTSQSRKGRNILAAETIARASHQAIQSNYEDFFHLPRGKAIGAAQRIGKIVLPYEVQALEQWAIANEVLLSSDEILSKWEDQGNRGGLENKVFYDTDRRQWIKINNLSYHTNQLEFLHRLALHNFLFPEVSLALEGYIWDGSCLSPVVSQPHVMHHGENVSEQESGSELEKMGGAWSDVENGYIFNDLGIVVTDTHDENVLRRQDGGLSFIDPDVRLLIGLKGNRLKDSNH